MRPVVAMALWLSKQTLPSLRDEVTCGTLTSASSVLRFRDGAPVHDTVTSLRVGLLSADS